MSADIGDIFEDQLQVVMDRLKAEYLMQWHAFPDHKRSNGGATGTQPSDYLVGMPEGCNQGQRMMFWEAKASDKYKTLQKSLVKPSQRGYIHRWNGLCNLPYLIVFYSAPAGALELWNGQAITAGKSGIDKSQRLVRFDGVGSGRLLDADMTARKLASFFNLPPMQQTVKMYERRLSSSQ